MAPKYPYPCFRCHSGKQLAKRTIQIHFRENLNHLDQLRASGADQDTVDLLQDYHHWIIQLFNSLAEESQSSRQFGSPYPDGEYLLFDALIVYLLICLDLADDPMASPSFPEDVLRDDDAMLVDDYRK
jgi:hypothetical protein